MKERNPIISRSYCESLWRELTRNPPPSPPTNKQARVNHKQIERSPILLQNNNKQYKWKERVTNK